MKYNQTVLGELYEGFDLAFLTGFEKFLDSMDNTKKRYLWSLHKVLIKNKLSDSLSKINAEDIASQMNLNYSLLTTYANNLRELLKKYAILQKVDEKNIYTETLWGEILIERGLKRNLLLKISNFKFDLYKDSYALMKKFFHEREQFFYQRLILTKKTYKSMINNQKKHIKAFKDYMSFYFLEQYAALASYSLVANDFSEKEKNRILKFSNDLINDDSIPIKISALTLIIGIDLSNDDYYNRLNDLFYKEFNRQSYQSFIQVISALLNFGYKNRSLGKERYYRKNYELFKFLENEGILHKQGVFSGTTIINYLRAELQFGSIEKAETILNESLDSIPRNQKESFQYLVESEIQFAKSNYSESLLKVSQIDPKESVFYYQLYKALLIKCNIMLGDIDRLSAEQENFYKYILNNKKKIPADAQQRHKLFIRYSDYLTEERFEYLSAHMYKRMEKAIQPDSPYFTEKPWVRERWEFLKDKFDK